MTVPYCKCSHAQQIHSPTGSLADTTERGHGPCTGTAWGHPCACQQYREKPQ